MQSQWTNATCNAMRLVCKCTHHCTNVCVHCISTNVKLSPQQTLWFTSHVSGHRSIRLLLPFFCRTVHIKKLYRNVWTDIDLHRMSERVMCKLDIAICVMPLADRAIRAAAAIRCSTTKNSEQCARTKCIHANGRLHPQIHPHIPHDSRDWPSCWYT